MQSTTDRSIQIVVLKGLCVGCGTCYSVCPLEAITLDKKDIFEPSVNEEKCNNCGLCEQACPGAHIDYKLHDAKTSQTNRHSFLIGQYANLYLGNAHDNHLRFMGSSGGVSTAILSYAFENKIINGALVVTSHGLHPEVMTAKSSKELEQAMGSKYIPVPLNIGLRNIINSEGNFAVAGLPCQLLGLDQMTRLYPCLAKKIVLRIGLFCGRGFDYHYVNFFLRSLGISPASVTSIRFRGHGWPGKVSIKYKSKGKDNETLLDYGSYGKYSGSYLFMPRRCAFCPDHAAELADISIGDAPFSQARTSKLEGTAIIITRTPNGEKILSEAVQNEFMEISKSSLKPVIDSQRLQLHFHKTSLETRRRLARLLGMSIPSTNVNSFSANSFPTVLFGATLVATQAFYPILKRLHVSEFIPKPLVRNVGRFLLLTSSLGFNIHNP